MQRIKDVKNRTKSLPHIHSVAQYEQARKKNLYRGIWACPCGSRKFHLIQQKDNVKTVCCKCEDIVIIAWNGKVIKSKRLDTLEWKG